MAITDLLTYHTGSSGRLASWACGNASIKAPLLKKLSITVQKVGSDYSPEAKEKLFADLLSIEGKVGEEFLAALDAENIVYLDIVNGVSEYESSRGRIAGQGSKKGVKVMRGFAKALALKYPFTMEKEVIFSNLLEFIENTDNQENIYKEFAMMASKNGFDKESGMIALRQMTLETKEALVKRGMAMGAARAKNRASSAENK